MTQAKSFSSLLDKGLSMQTQGPLVYKTNSSTTTSKLELSFQIDMDEKSKDYTKQSWVTLMKLAEPKQIS